MTNRRIRGISFALLALAFIVSGPARSQGAPKAADELRASRQADGDGVRVLQGKDDWVRFSWKGDRHFDGTYMLNLIVDFVDPSVQRSQLVLDLGWEPHGVERREIRLRDRLPVQLVLSPTYVDGDGQLVATLRPSASGLPFRVRTGSLTLQRWSAPRKVYPSRRAVKARAEGDGLFRLEKEGDRIHYRFAAMNDERIVRLEGAARIPLPPRDEAVRSRRVLVGVGNRLGGMRYEYPMWMPGALERVPASRADVNLLGTVDIVVGWAEGGPLLLGPQDVWLEVYLEQD